jgi:hypothetical protein
MQNRSVPTDSVLPHLVYADVSGAAQWLNRVFGFVEHYRYGEPVSGVQMMLGNACIMLKSARTDLASPAQCGVPDSDSLGLCR